jgi:hypothetical protein
MTTQRTAVLEYNNRIVLALVEDRKIPFNSVD